MISERVTPAKLAEFVPLAADFYVRHSRDATNAECRVLIMLAKANAATKSEIAGKGNCSDEVPGGKRGG